MRSRCYHFTGISLLFLACHFGDPYWLNLGKGSVLALRIYFFYPSNSRQLLSFWGISEGGGREEAHNCSYVHQGTVLQQFHSLNTGTWCWSNSRIPFLPPSKINVHWRSFETKWLYPSSWDVSELGKFSQSLEANRGLAQKWKKVKMKKRRCKDQ